MEPKSTKALMGAAIKSVGATRDTVNEADTIIVDAPEGFVFAANNCSVLVSTTVDELGHSKKQEAYADMIERLSYGLRPQL